MSIEEKPIPKILQFMHKHRFRQRIFLSIFILFIFLVFFQIYYTESFETITRKLQRATCGTAPLTKTVVFQDHAQYEDLSHSFDALWNNLSTPNGGFLKYEENGIVKTFGISMFHQLHCVQTLREIFQSVILADNTIHHDHYSHGDPNHWLHWLDYLRQTILCHADDTLESAYLHDNVTVVDGLGPRKCRDPEVLYEMARNSLL